MKTMIENIATWKVPDVEKKIDALNRKAKKLGLPSVMMELGEESVRIDGWQLVAVLDHGIGEKPVIRSVEGTELPERYRDAKPICDHCGYDRRRKDTFILEHISQAEYRQVGRTCLGDYLGGNTAQAIIAYAAWIGQFGLMMDKWREPDDPYGPRGREEARWDLEGFLAYTAAEIRKNGWVSRSQAKEQVGEFATADAVLETLWKRPTEREEAERQLTDEMRVEAKAAVAWAAGLEADNDYLHNIRVIAEAGWTNARNAGFAASILTSYRRAMDREIETKLAAERSADAGYFGEPGKRIRGITVRIAGLREIAGNYGPTTIVTMRTREGHNLKWFASGYPNLDRDESYLVDLTVKGHEVYQGAMQTRVNRVRVLSGA